MIVGSLDRNGTEFPQCPPNSKPNKYRNVLFVITIMRLSIYLLRKSFEFSEKYICREWCLWFHVDSLLDCDTDILN